MEVDKNIQDNSEKNVSLISFSDESDTSGFSEKDFKESEINLETNKEEENHYKYGKTSFSSPISLKESNLSNDKRILINSQ